MLVWLLASKTPNWKGKGFLVVGCILECERSEMVSVCGRVANRGKESVVLIVNRNGNRHGLNLLHRSAKPLSPFPRLLLFLLLLLLLFAVAASVSPEIWQVYSRFGKWGVADASALHGGLGQNDGMSQHHFLQPSLSLLGT